MVLRKPTYDIVELRNRQGYELGLDSSASEYELSRLRNWGSRILATLIDYDSRLSSFFATTVIWLGLNPCCFASVTETDSCFPLSYQVWPSTCTVLKVILGSDAERHGPESRLWWAKWVELQGVCLPLQLEELAIERYPNFIQFPRTTAITWRM